MVRKLICVQMLSDLGPNQWRNRRKYWVGQIYISWWAPGLPFLCLSVYCVHCAMFSVWRMLCAELYARLTVYSVSVVKPCSGAGLSRDLFDPHIPPMPSAFYGRSITKLPWISDLLHSFALIWLIPWSMTCQVLLSLDIYDSVNLV